MALLQLENVFLQILQIFKVFESRNEPFLIQLVTRIAGLPLLGGNRAEFTDCERRPHGVQFMQSAFFGNNGFIQVIGNLIPLAEKRIPELLFRIL